MNARIAPADLAQPITKPGQLIEIDFSPPRYFSTRGVQGYGGKTWVTGAWVFATDRLTLPGGDPAMTQLVLSQGVVGRRVRVWTFIGDYADDTNTELTYDGVIDGASDLIDPVTLMLFDRSISVMYSPRQRIRADTGFSVLPQKGLKITWKGIKFVFKDDPK
jgi:hypothetical protein